MQLLSIAICRYDDDADISTIICQEIDTSTFTYFTRQSIKEYMIFTAREISKRINHETASSIKVEQHICHAFKKQNGLTICIITNDQYPSNTAHQLIRKIFTDFQSEYQSTEWTKVAENGIKWDKLSQFLNEYKQPSINSAKMELKEVEQILKQNIDDILSRGEKLDSLLSTSQDIGCVSKSFHKKAKKMNSFGGFSSFSFGLSSTTSQRNNSNTIGFSVGGAKDVGNFRKCIEQNIMPKPGSIAYSGLLYEYQFDTETVGDNNETENIIEEKDDGKEKDDDGSKLFYPTYCYAKIKKLNFDVGGKNEEKENLYPTPETKNDDDEEEVDGEEYWMTVGLNSNIKEDEFKRKNLNLVVVMDKSGSMGDAFDGDNINFAYNYDPTKTKMYIANNAVITLIEHLTDKDRFGLIIFEEKAEIIQNLNFVSDINKNELTKKIMNIKEGGGTNFESGYNEAIKLYNKMSANKEYENRIIFFTDAQPNVGNTNPKSLLNLLSLNALNKNKRIYSTIIGVGLDFNAKLIDTITKTRGCNYYTVNSTKEFMNKMKNEFEYMVTPLVFNVVLKLKCEGNSCKIQKVYGSNDQDYSQNILKNGQITKIDTLFPSKKCAETGEIQGGILLIKLKKSNKCKNIDVSIEVTFEDRNDNLFKNQQNVIFKNHKIEPKIEDMIDNDDENDIIDFSGNYYDNIGIRKGILLCKYIEILIEWIEFENKRSSSAKSNNLRMNTKYKNIFVNFLKYFEKEMKICKDEKLEKEIVVLNKLINIDIDDTDLNKESTYSLGSVTTYFGNMFGGLKKQWYG